MINYLFLFATGAFGWGLSLATYRYVAKRNSWPMGALHLDLPAVPIAIGALAVLAGLSYAVDEGAAAGGWAIIVFGVALAAFWTGFLRVGSQTSLILAPLSAVLLLFSWASSTSTNYGSITFDDRSSYGRAALDRNSGN
ncbi:MAG: hypothetical protein K0U34_04800 [Alphaproteobacteria bacterium]|nr:hypothetical protein [Alphaproteobacteria bacterium]